MKYQLKDKIYYVSAYLPKAHKFFLQQEKYFLAYFIQKINHLVLDD